MTTKYRLQRLKKCANCGHHVSAHRYTPGRLGAGPGSCSIPGCSCKEFRRPAPGERLGKAKPNSWAWETTTEDVAEVLRGMGIHATMGQAERALDAIVDVGLVEKAALRGHGIDEQTKYAHQEIKRQIAAANWTWEHSVRRNGRYAPEPLRHVRLDGGYTLQTWDTHETDRHGKWQIAYEFRDPKGHILFKGDDFYQPPYDSIDGDHTLRGLLGFLTLQPGDTDQEYFDGYSDKQMAFAKSSDAESLKMYAEEEEAGDEFEPPAFEDIEQ